MATKEEIRMKFFGLVRDERYRQEELWGEDNDRNHTGAGWIAILTKELGDVARELFARHSSTAHLQAAVRNSLIHVAAVCCAWIECMETGGEGG